MLTFGIIFAILAIIGIILACIVGDDYDFGDGLGSGVLIASFIVLAIVSFVSYSTRYNTTEKSLKDNTLEVQIKVETLNGAEINRDTVYVFTPKHK